VANAELELLQALRDWQARGHAAALATVARTFGSSPRPAGSIVLVRDDGAVVGSVSGGCIEQDLIERVQAGMPQLPQLLSYGGTPEENQRIGLPCGGRLEIVFERAPDAAIVDQLAGALHAARPIARKLDLRTGTSFLFTPDEADRFAWDGTVLVTVHRPQLRLLIVGAVHTARFLAEMAQSVGYAVVVCDPREEYRATWNVAGAALLDGMPDDVVQAIRPNERTAIIALTHDPKLDDLALLEALRSDAFYVGALGSRRNNARRRERLGLFDLAPEQIARLRGPVGLPIGSRTPSEIAVAILADLIATRNGVHLVASARQKAAGNEAASQAALSA
jgi:xanthine dehydrogenase accessory factor